MTKRSKTFFSPAVAVGLVLAVTWFACCPQPVGAVPQIETRYGSHSSFFTPEINAMGGTGVSLYRGALSNILNPAMLSQEQGMRLDACLSLDQQHEDRFQPLFDTFDSYVTDVAIASNRNHYYQAGFGLSRFMVESPRPVTMAVSLTDRYAYDYDFFEEIRDPDPFSSPRDRVLQDRTHKIKGKLRDLSTGFSVLMSDRVSLGAAVHYAFGTRTEITRERDYDDPNGSYKYEKAFSQSGLNFGVGARVIASERIEIGLAWESPLTIDGDVHYELYEFDADDDAFTTTRSRSSREVKYPNIFRGGVTFLPRTDPQTEFTVEFEFSEWSKVEDTLTPATGEPLFYEDTFDMRVGVQHTFYNGVPIRFGFRHYNSYFDMDTATSAFSGGVGMPVVGGMVSASVELSKLVSVQPHQFEYPSDFTADPDARVEDTRFRVGVGFTRGF